MVLFVLLMACSGGPPVVGNAADGETVYTSNCVVCHGADGSGVIEGASDLPVEVPTMEDAEIETLVLEGRDAMPAYDFDEQEMADLLAYLRAAFQ